MKVITMYEADDGEVFGNEADALLHDLECKIAQNVQASPGSQSCDDVAIARTIANNVGLILGLARYWIKWAPEETAAGEMVRNFLEDVR